MFHFLEHLKNACRESDFTLTENSNEISSEEYHDERSEQTEHAREEWVDIDSLSESSEESSEKPKSENSRGMKEHYVSRITDIILRGFCCEREDETADNSETARYRSDETNDKTRHRRHSATNTEVEYARFLQNEKYTQKYESDWNCLPNHSALFFGNYFFF